MRTKTIITIAAVTFVIVLSVLSIYSLTPHQQVPHNYSSCLKKVPDGAVISILHNSTFQGYSAMSINGTRTLFPLDSCLRPAHPLEYLVASAIEANPKFRAAENGSLYGLDPFSFDPTATYGYNNTEGAITCTMYAGNNWTYVPRGCIPYTELVFRLYSNQKIPACDGSYTDTVLGQIVAGIPKTPTGGLDLTHISIRKEPSDSLNPITCITTVTA
jgi:hypothetical protein